MPHGITNIQNTFLLSVFSIIIITSSCSFPPFQPSCYFPNLKTKRRSYIIFKENLCFPWFKQNNRNIFCLMYLIASTSFICLPDSFVFCFITFFKHRTRTIQLIESLEYWAMSHIREGFKRHYGKFHTRGGGVSELLIVFYWNWNNLHL